MKLIPTLAAVSVLGILVGCVHMDAARPEPTTAPEFMNCENVPNALAHADSIVRTPGYISSTELAFWKDRKERLVKRAWDCKS